VAIRLGDLARARRHLEEALRLRPDSAVAHHNLALVHLESGGEARAIAHYEEALRLDPDYAAAHDSLGNVLANRGEIAAAVDHFAAVLRLEPGNAGVPAKLLVMEGRFRAAIERTPGDAEAHYFLGLVAAARGNPGEAAAHLRRALELARATGRDGLAAEVAARLERLGRTLDTRARRAGNQTLTGGTGTIRVWACLGVG
jgi:tetratricopeptide (TPR) repeat protein